jgi:hypothetical protein
MEETLLRAPVFATRRKCFPKRCFRLLVNYILSLPSFINTCRKTHGPIISCFIYNAPSNSNRRGLLIAGAGEYNAGL